MGPFVLTIAANRACVIGGKTYTLGQTVTLEVSEIGPEVPVLIEKGYVTSDPPLPTDPAFLAAIQSGLDADPGAAYQVNAYTDKFDEEIADTATADYEHNLNSNHVGVLGRVQRLTGSGGPVAEECLPGSKTDTLDVQLLVIDENTIRVKNNTGGAAIVRVILQAYKIG